MITAVTDEDTTDVTVKVTANVIPTGTLYQDPDNPDKTRREVVKISNYNKSDILWYIQYNVCIVEMQKCCDNHACLHIILGDLNIIE